MGTFSSPSNGTKAGIVCCNKHAILNIGKLRYIELVIDIRAGHVLLAVSNLYSLRHENKYVLWKLKNYYCVHKKQPLDRVLCQMNPVLILTACSSIFILS
jgi:hypothetical protein